MDASLLTGIFIVFASLIVLWIIIGIIRTAREKHEVSRLRKSGTRVLASVTDIQSRQETGAP